MAIQFNRRFSGPVDEAIAAGQKPGDFNQLGPRQSQAYMSPRFVAEYAKRLPQKENPGSGDLWDTNVFDNDTAQRQQQVIDAKARANDPTFEEPFSNALAADFLGKYARGVERGLIEPERAIYSGTLARLATQPANFGSSEKDPNTANKFPGAEGTQV
jgi:hypothetical protein